MSAAKLTNIERSPEPQHAQRRRELPRGNDHLRQPRHDGVALALVFGDCLVLGPSLHWGAQRGQHVAVFRLAGIQERSWLLVPPIF